MVFSKTSVIVQADEMATPSTPWFDVTNHDLLGSFLLNSE